MPDTAQRFVQVQERCIVTDKRAKDIQVDSAALSPRENRPAAYNIAAVASARNTPEITLSDGQAESISEEEEKEKNERKEK
ncbi:hypothetical protein MMC30_007826 [Trapelia coarctata]|nr:hypothetical protein [Trapelia coarctata]